MFRLSFFSVSILLGAVLGHAYLYRRLVRDTGAGRWVRWGAGGLFTAMGLLLLARRSLQDVLPPAWGETVTRGMYGWMGGALLVLLALLGWDLGRGLWWVKRRLSREPPVDAERRRFLARTVAGGALATGGSMAVYGSWRAFTPPRVTEVVLKIPRLPRTLDGLSVVQLSDIHVGPFLQRRYMDELVRQTNALKPDLVAITGDLVDGDVATLGGHVAALAALRARFGSFFVTGNHDYYSGDVEWVAFLESLGIQALRNRHVRIGDAGGSLDLVGVDDWSGGRRSGRKGYDLDQALAGRDPGRAAVLLAHQPANFHVAAKRGIDVQLSGHTHGGQLPPMTFLIGLEWRYAAGLYGYQDSHIFVSRGCGFWGPPMRVGSPPEIVKLVLTA